MSDKLNLTAEQIDAGLALLQKSRRVRRRGETVTLDPRVTVDGKGRVALTNLYEAEVSIARDIRRLAQATVRALEVPEGAFPFTPDESQQAAIEKACSAAVVIITGGPGVGKTTITRAILAAYSAGGIRVACCAPTGKAALRMKAQTGFEAKTIHSTIGLIPGDVPTLDVIEAGAVVTDESSMTDVELAGFLFSRIRTGTRLLIIGDVDQLPSVGPGRVLYDLISSNVVPVVRLEKIYRQSELSRIPYVARDINRGFVPAELHATGTDFTHWECRGQAGGVRAEDVAADRIVRAVSDKEASITVRKGFALDDVQVLAPQYKGPCGIVELNTRLQAALNPGDANDAVFVGKAERRYGVRVGDRVIHVRNNRDLGLANGEIGKVIAASPAGLDYQQVVQPDLHWSDKVSSSGGDDGDAWGDEDGGGIGGAVGGLKWIIDERGDRKQVWQTPRVLVVDFGGRCIAYAKAESTELELAYCISVHKSQGGSWKAVVFALPATNPRMLSRQLFYTGVTRAEEFCLTVGSEDQVRRAVRNTHGTNRRTTLLERLTTAPARNGEASKLVNLPVNPEPDGDDSLTRDNADGMGDL